jgi:hypothetical protein
MAITITWVWFLVETGVPLYDSKNIAQEGVSMSAVTSSP